MKICPNLSDAQVAEKWYALVNDPELGELEAMKEFMESEKENRPIGTPEEVKKKLELRYAIKSDAAIAATDAEQTANTNTYIGDPTLTDSDTNTGITLSNNPIVINDDNIQEMDNSKALEIATKLSDQLGVAFSIVTPEQAVEITKGSKNAFSILKGKAFFYQGHVYFVGNALTTVSALHEFSHPIVRAMSTENPELFDKLFSEALIADPSLMDEAVGEYEDLKNTMDNEQDPGNKEKLKSDYKSIVKEEVIVKALAKAAELKQKQQEPTSAFTKFLKNLLFAIKQYLRKKFGQKIDISKLDESTSLDKLAEMLVAGKNFNIDPTLMSKDEIVAYMEERDKVLEDVTKLDPEALAILSTNAYDIAKKQVRLLIENKNYKALAELLIDEYSRGDLQEIMSNLKQHSGDIVEKAEKLINDMERTQNNCEALVNTLYRLNKVLGHIEGQLSQLRKASKEDTGDDQTKKDNLHKAYYYKHIIDYWSEYITIAKKTMKNAGASNSSPIFKMLQDMEQTTRDAEDSIMDIYKDGTSTYLYEELGDMAKAADEEFENIIKTLKKQGAKQSSIDKRFKEYHNLTELEYNNMIRLRNNKLAGERLTSEELNDLDLATRAHSEGIQLTKEKIEMALTGQLKDASFLNNFFEGYMYSTDPVIGGFAAYFKKNMSEVQVRAQNKTYDFINSIEKLVKDAGINFHNIGELGRDIGFIDEVGGYDENGKFVMKKRWRLLNKYKNFQYEIDEFDNKIKDLEAIYFRSGQTDDGNNLRTVKKQKAAHLRTWFKQEFQDDFYEKDKVFDKGPDDEVGSKAKERRDNIFQEMRKITEPLTSESEILDANEKMANLWREYRLMHSLYDLNGNLKVGDELEIAKRLVEYKETARKYYEFRPRTGAFENAYKKFKLEIESKLKREGFKDDAYTEEFNRLKAKWLEKNTVTKIKQSFYTKRAEILAKINNILSNLPKEQRDQLDFSKPWITILDAVSGFRDDNGQPLGNEITDGRKKNVKDAQQAMIEAQEKWAGYSGLSRKDMNRLQDLFKIKKKRRLTVTEKTEFDTLIDTKDTLGLDKYQRQDLYDAYEELGELQSKDPTDSYLEVANNWYDQLDQTGIPFNEITAENVNTIFNGENLKKLLKQSPEFKDWFEKNHIVKTKINKKGVKSVIHERLYVWSVIKPNDSEHYESTKIKNEDGSEENLPTVPSLKYFARVVKKEFRTGYDPEAVNADGTKGGVRLKVGEHIDNMGNFLPKDIENSPYRNKEYYELQKNKPALFKLLEKITETHLEWQKGSPRSSKLYMDFPRFPKSDLEVLQSGLAKKKIGEKLTVVGQVLKRVKDFFMGGRADLEDGVNINVKNQIKLVQTDMFDNRIHKIPMHGTYDLDDDLVSTDIVTSMIKYMYSAETQKKLIEINPVAQAIKAVLSNDANKLKEIDQINSSNARNRNFLSYVNKEGKYQRKEHFDAFYQKNFLAQNNAGFGADIPWIQNATNFMFGKAANAFFALNITGALRNSFGAKWQALIMGAGGKYFNWKHYAKGEAWAAKTMGKVSFNVYNGKVTDLDLLMLETFDPAQGRTQEKLGVGFTRTITKDIVDRSWLVSVRKWTELQSTLAGFGAMMHKQKIIKEDGSQIDYINAFEVKDGRLVLKAGIDAKWGITYDEAGNPILGSEFVKMKNRVHMVTNKLIGAVAKFDQPDAKRYVLFRLVSFMKGYFTEMAMNRFGKHRMNVGLGTPDEGYYITAVKSFIETCKSRNLAHMTPEDKRSFMMVATEIGLMMLSGMLAYGMFGGFDPDDPDKYAKLRAKSGPLGIPFVGEGESDFHLGGFLEVHSMLLLMQIQNENMQFMDPRQLVPMFTDLKSIGFGPTLNTYAKIGTDMLNMLKGSDKAYYERRIGPYEWEEEGGYKIFNHAARMFGINANQISPADALQSWQNAQQLTNFR